MEQITAVRVETDKGVEVFTYRSDADARFAADNFAHFGWKATIGSIPRRLREAV